MASLFIFFMYEVKLSVEITPAAKTMANAARFSSGELVGNMVIAPLGW
jgi:hypothetical protein